MNLALILVHNKSDIENVEQIEFVKSLITEVVDGPFINEETGETWTTIHHEFKDLDLLHELKIYQVVPYDKTPPLNIYKINSGGIVQYLKGDEDKIGDHPRFFNWGLKRGTDYGAEIVIYIEDYTKFDVSKLVKKLEKLADKNDKTEFTEDDYGKLVTFEALKEVGQLDEAKIKDEAFIDYKQRVIEKGLKNG